MFELKYNNFYKKYDKLEKLYIFYPIDKNNKIIINNGLSESNFIISSKKTVIINNNEFTNSKNELLLKPNETAQISSTDLLKIYYIKNINLNKNINNNANITYANFDWEKYINDYHDLIQAKINTKELAWNHWYYTGINEDRKAYNIYHAITYENFDWEKYIKDYQDLQRSGINTKKKAWKHWYYTGINEERVVYKYKSYITFENFDWEKYINDYQDLIQAGIDTKEKAWNHWYYTGINEGRKAYDFNDQKNDISSEKFDWIQYFNNLRNTNIFNNVINNVNIKNTIINNTQTKNKNNNKASFLDEYYITITKHHKVNYSFIPIGPDALDIINKFILIVDFQNGGGGTTFFINSIVSKYKLNNTFIIARNYDNNLTLTINDEYELEQKYNTKKSLLFLEENKSKIEKIFVNHTMFHNKLFLNKLFQLNKETILITHDYYSISNNPQPLIDELPDFIDNKISNINKFNKIITQNIKNLFILDKYITNDKIDIIVEELPDYKDKDTLINIDDNVKITIGIIGAISDIKGKNILKNIIDYYSNNNNIEIIVFGIINIKNFKNFFVYKNVAELNELMSIYKPNILLELSIWPETYSYTLSLAMITDLPILYVKKTNNFTVEERLSHYPKAYLFNNLDELNDLVYLHKQDYFYTIKPCLNYSLFWDNLFKKNNEKKCYPEIKYKNNINIFPIYFPQFHTIPENNISFYKNFNDIINLNLLPENSNKETPNLNEFNLKCITDYNLTKINIIQKQIDIIDEYNYAGFAMYYYWFSTNTITNNHMIMENVLNLFFNKKINIKNKKIFFIWANESWTNNHAFGYTDKKIENTYNIENINLNVKNLIIYFKHKNYLKINNKPVFLLYHPWFMNNDEIALFKKTLYNTCIDNNFNGIKFIINSMNGQYSGYSNFSLNFNYKISKSTFVNNNQIFLDYKKYIQNDIVLDNNIINTLVFNFDNRARLFKPDKLKYSTICIGNSEFNKIQFIKKIQQMYLNQTNNKYNIMLINSWNEWGEKMAIEPSNEYDYYYLNLILEHLT